MFNHLIGNIENKEILKSMIDNNNISHSYIFSGISGVGKFAFAKEFAKAITCLSDTEQKPCNHCKACESFDNANNPDIIIIDENDDSIKTEIIKELTNNNLEKPIQGDKKIYIINNSENMTKEAQNSILKTLEEPPQYAIIILITSNENMLLNTIKSRCIRIPFHRLTNNELKEYFDRIGQSINTNLIKAFDGSIEKALRIKDKEEEYRKIQYMFSNLETLNELQILNIKEIILSDKEEILFVLDYINTIFLDNILGNISNAEKYEKCIEIIEETKQRLKRNCNFDMTIDNCLFAIERSLKING